MKIDRPKLTIVGCVNVNNERNVGPGVILQSGFYIPAFRKRLSILSWKYTNDKDDVGLERQKP